MLSTIRAKLSTWKGKMSMVGMICLIKSVLSSLPLYYMSIYHMPKVLLMSYLLLITLFYGVVV
jgi:hypothetical protein